MLDWKLARRKDLLQEIGGESGAYFLHESERRRLANINQSGRREEFIASRWLARKTLCANFGGAAGDWDIAAEHGQAPLVTGPALANLSISHSGEWIAVAVSNCAVGLDIECVKQRKNTLALAEMAANPGETQALIALQEPARSAQFIQFWTIKEAWLKSRGSGLDFDLMRRLDNQPVRLDQTANAVTCVAAGGELAMAMVTALRLTVMPPMPVGVDEIGYWMVGLESEP